MIIKYCLDEGAFAPTKAHRFDAGLDMRTPIDIVVGGNDSVFIDTGIHIEVPENYGANVESKSGLMVKNNIITAGLVDCGYTGTIGVKLFNLGHTPKYFKRGDKIAQLVIRPIAKDVIMDEVSFEVFKKTERGNNGFGSSGR